jgi:hypothetical protein
VPMDLSGGPDGVPRPPSKDTLLRT